jgi:acetyltransferase-like isoleucine patch superfamily enzyme
MTQVDCTTYSSQARPRTFFQKVVLHLSDNLDYFWSVFVRIVGPLFLIRVGKSTIIRRGAKLSTKLGGSINLGDFCEIHPTAMILSYGGQICIGDNCSLNPGSIIYGHGGVTIGSGVRIAAHSVIIPANHEIRGSADSIYRKPLTKKGITIESNVWIGTHCVILDGVRVAEGCVIAAGAVVATSTEPNGIYAGIPARRIKSRDASLDKTN